jgi:hypothetical protein
MSRVPPAMMRDQVFPRADANIAAEIPSPVFRLVSV